MIPSFPFKLTSNHLHTKIRKEKCFQFQHDSKFVRTLYPIRGGSTCGLRHWPYGWRVLLNRQDRIGWRVSNLGWHYRKILCNFVSSICNCIFITPFLKTNSLFSIRTFSENSVFIPLHRRLVIQYSGKENSVILSWGSFKTNMI